jgi:hypothetical protein
MRPPKENVSLNILAWNQIPVKMFFAGSWKRQYFFRFVAFAADIKALFLYTNDKNYY